MSSMLTFGPNNCISVYNAYLHIQVGLHSVVNDAHQSNYEVLDNSIKGVRTAAVTKRFLLTSI